MSQNIWFTSDTHYHHKNIVRGTTSWDNSQEVRNFDTLEEHDDTLLINFNSLVKEDDILYHLGDWSFGGIQQIWEFRKKLICKNVHLIFGNHDQHIENKGSFIEIKNDLVERPLYVELAKGSGEFVAIKDNLIKARLYPVFSSTQYVKEISVNKQKFFLSHYSHQVWDQSHHGTIHLFGHSHGTLQGIGRSMDVGVDTHNMFPYHLDEILDLMKDVKWAQVDHHNETTN